MKFFAAVGLLILCATLAPATNCQQRVIQQYAQVEYQQAVYVPLVVAVPQYSAAFSPEALFGRKDQQPAAESPALQELLQEVRKIRAEVEQIKRGSGTVIEPKLEPLPPLPLKSSQALPHMKIFQAKCAACHEFTVAEKKGGGFTLMNGQSLATLSAEQRLKIVTQIYTGKMPKNDKILDEEVHQVVLWLDSVK